MSRLTWPTSTMRTTCIVSGVVTRRPPANVLSMPSRSRCVVDLRAAAVHDDDPDAGVAQEDDVLGERLLQRRLGHRVAAVLDDDVVPWNRSSHGSASISADALPSARADVRRGGRCASS